MKYDKANSQIIYIFFCLPSLNVGSFEYFITSILDLISCLLSPGIHFYDLKKNIYSEIKFMSVWYFLLHSIFHISLLVILCNFICHFWICIQVVRYASSVKKATIYYIVTWCTRCNCFCGRSVVFSLVNLHSLSRVVVPATLHNISVNAHFTRFL